MRTPKTKSWTLSALVATLVLPVQAIGDHHNIAQRETPGRAMASPSPYPAAQLGGTAGTAETNEWRERRAYARARDLSNRGIHVSEDQLDVWLSRMRFDVFEPDLEFLVSELRGTPTTAMLSVGMLMRGESVATAYSKCTVILTRPDTVLTARHCLSYAHGGKFWVYFPYGGIRSVLESGISFFCEDGDSDCSITADDLATAKLDAPFTHISPSIPGAASTAEIGLKAKIVGFGLNTPDLSDYGVKREGVIELADCVLAPTDGLSLCFEHPLGEDGTSIYAACNNDSGGPMTNLASDPQGNIGVASQMFGTCDGKGEGRYVNITNERYDNWLKDAYCDPACPTDPNLVLTELVRVPIGYLDSAEAEHVYTFTVPEDASSLIFTLNHGRGWFPNQNNFDLELSAELAANCVRFFEAEVCEVSAPPAGSYSATVKRIHGEADYQLSAVALSTTDGAEPESPVDLQ